MIDKTRIKNSRFDILEKDQSQIQKYIEKEAKKSEKQRQKEKDLRNKKVSIENVNLQENYDNQDKDASNNIIIHTVKDNLTHNYFHYFSMYWDAGDCMSSVVLKMPKTDTGNTKYWITYTGDVEVYTGNNIDKMTQSTTDENNSVTNETYWDLQGMSPLFRGEVGRIKEYQDFLEIHIDSIGKRFKQKIPDEFRQAFINGQNVRDAFQAICEFIGVKYICPPAAPKTDDQPQTDGTEKDVSKAMEDAGKVTSEAISKLTDSENKTDKNSVSASYDVGGSSQESQQNTGDQNTSTTDQVTEANTPQNGYTDIAFDAGGAITHGSAAIETSPDMTETLIELDEHPLDKYLEDTTYVAADVKKFLNGEFFETLHGNFLSYGSVTIEPTSASSSEMSSVGGATPSPTDPNGDSESNGDSSGNGGGSSSGNGGGGSTVGAPGVWGKTAKGSYYLTKEAINKMSREEAWQRYQDGKKNNRYTAATMSKLLQRSFGIWLF